MTKYLSILLTFLISTSVMAQKAKREMLIKEDSTVIKTVKDYEDFSYTDTAGRVNSGKVFLKNDSQFYYLNYFNEQKGPIHNINEIKGTYVNLTSTGVSNRKRSGQKYFLSPGAVAAIYFLSGGLAVPFLLIRELVLYYRYGQGHSLDRGTKATTSIVYKTKLNIKIQRIQSGS